MNWVIVGWLWFSGGGRMIAYESIQEACGGPWYQGTIFIVERSSDSYRFTKGRCEPERIVKDELEQRKPLEIEVWTNGEKPGPFCGSPTGCVTPNQDGVILVPGKVEITPSNTIYHGVQP